MQIISRYRCINFAEASKKARVYQNANYGWRSPPEDHFSDFSLRITVRFPVDDRSGSRWHNAQWLFLPPLLEEPFISAYDFTALWFYHLNSASSDLSYRFPLSLFLFLSLSLFFSHVLFICLRLPFRTLSSPPRCRTRHYVTIVPWNWTSFMYRMSMTLSWRAPHRTHVTTEHAKSMPAPLWKT